MKKLTIFDACPSLKDSFIYIDYLFKKRSKLIKKISSNSVVMKKIALKNYCLYIYIYI